MTKAEQMTRSAARLIGLDVSEYEWSEDVLGLIEKVPYTDKSSEMVQARVFSPLSDPCDAFMVEATGHMSVRCEYNGFRLAMYVSTPRPGLEDLGYMASARVDLIEDVMRARMLAVTQFAELMSLAEQCDG